MDSTNADMKRPALMLPCSGAAARLRLEAVLRQLIACHGELLDLVRAQRTAFTLGNLHALRDAAGRESVVLQRARDLDRRRRDLTLALLPTPSHGGASDGAPRLLDVAASLPAVDRDRLVSLRDELLVVMHAVQRETTIARRATEALLRHTHGLLITLGQIARGSTHYAPRGGRPTHTPTLSTMSLVG